MPDSEKKLMRVVLKEELIALTGDWLKALILNQFLYWGERRKDFDAFILEERLRITDPNLELTHGWIWKSVKELSEELMVKPLSNDTINRRLAEIVESGWLEQRRNPHHKWDRTYQYRPAIRKLQADLQALGYALEGYPLLIENSAISRDAESSTQDALLIPPDAEMNLDDAGALPESPTETLLEIPTEEAAAKKMPPLPPASDAHQHAIDAANGSTAPDPAQVVAEHLHSGYMGAPVPLPSGKQERKKWIEAGRRLLRRFEDYDLRQLCYNVDCYWQNPDDFWRDKPCHDETLDLIARAYLQRQAAAPAPPPPPLPPSAPDPLAVAWGRVLDEVRLTVTEATFLRYLAPTELVSRENGDILVYVPRPQEQEFIEHRLAGKLQAAVAAQMGDVRISYTGVKP